MSAPITEQQVLERLRSLLDPELGLNVVDLGLVESIRIEDNGQVFLSMLVTSPGCPLRETLRMGAFYLLSAMEGITKAHVEVVDHVTWTSDRIAPEVIDSL
jgi:metal-sulfur cluster biosynthetic enzyme